MDEPFQLSLEQVGRLTLWQVNNLYFRPRDSRGRLRKPPGKPPESWEDTVKEIWRRAGLDEVRIRQKWRAYAAALNSEGRRRG